jgi:hypothetical protein
MVLLMHGFQILYSMPQCQYLRMKGQQHLPFIRLPQHLVLVLVISNFIQVQHLSSFISCNNGMKSSLANLDWVFLTRL